MYIQVIKLFVPVECLDTVKDNHKYHIYSIMSCPKIIYNHKTICSTKEKICFDLYKIYQEEKELIETHGFIIHKDLNHNETSIKCDFPYNNLEITILDKSWLLKHRNDEEPISISLDAQGAMNYLLTKYSKWEFEILYVGQAFGNDGKRLATDRLKSHSTLQKIFADYYNSSPDKRIFIMLLEFTPQLQASMDGLSGIYSASEDEEENHFNEIFNNPLKNNQIINSTFPLVKPL